jgi:hypothetical protein
MNTKKTTRSTSSSEVLLTTLPRLGAIVAMVALSPVLTERAALAFEARHAPLPLIGSEGGPVLATPRIVPVYYSADPLAADLGAFYAKLATSQYLAHALAGYGAASPVIAAPVVVSDAPPVSTLDTDIAAWLSAEIEAGVLPAEDGNTAYEVHFPATTQVNAGGLYGESYPTCYSFEFEAYLSSGTAVPFGVIPLCAGTLPSLTDLETATVFATSAIADQVTNPYVNDSPAYNEPSWSGSGWATLIGIQPGDLCFNTQDEWNTTPADLGYLAARIWSNAAAASGNNPCPDYSGTRETYFNAAPDIEGGTVLRPLDIVKGIILPVGGGSVTIPVRLFSDGPMHAWSLSAAERNDLDGQPSSVLSFSFDRAEGASGDVRNLTITRAPIADGGIAYPSETVPLAFAITSTSGTLSHQWIVAVSNE